MSTCIMDAPLDFSTKRTRPSSDDESRTISSICSSPRSSPGLGSDTNQSMDRAMDALINNNHDKLNHMKEDSYKHNDTNRRRRSKSRSISPKNRKLSQQLPVFDPMAMLYPSGLSGLGKASGSTAAAELYATYAATGALSSGIGSSPMSLDNLIPPYSPLASFISRKRHAPAPVYDEDEPKRREKEPEEKKDESYWDRRRKNNQAAKRSRDSRRMKEDEIAMRATYLEQENLKLRAQVAILKSETAKLHYMLYNRN